MDGQTQEGLNNPVAKESAGLMITQTLHLLHSLPRSLQLRRFIIIPPSHPIQLINVELVDTIFKGVPLTSLQINQPSLIRSFPNKLRYLCMCKNICSRYSLDYIAWNAVCRLQELTKLN